MRSREAHARFDWQTVAAAICLLLAPVACAVAAGPTDPAPLVSQPLLKKIIKEVTDPWFIFGMTAQFVFFMRFVVQWIASEKKRRSTVPVAFWYLSLVGSLALFVYALHHWDLVIMAGQFLACGIYVRNLMLISDWRKRRLQAGLPADDPDAEDRDTAVVAGKTVR